MNEERVSFWNSLINWKSVFDVWRGDEAKFQTFPNIKFPFQSQKDIVNLLTNTLCERKQFNWKFPNKSINFPLQFNFLFASWKKSFSISVFSKSTTEMKYKKMFHTNYFSTGLFYFQIFLVIQWCFSVFIEFSS